MKIIVDMSSLMWTALLAGKDVEATEAIREDGKVFAVNTAAYGYENAINMLVKSMDENGCTPKDLILVVEGLESKAPRKAISPDYKFGDSKVPEQYIQFNLLKEKLVQTLRDLGAIAVTQPYVEGDDIIAYLAQNMEDDCVIQTGDNDLAVLNGKNTYGADVTVRVGGEYAKNKYGDFPFKLITLYKALVGDPSDKIKGVQGFGPKAFEQLLETHSQENCAVLLRFIAQGQRDKLAEIAERKDCKILRKIVDGWSSAYTSYRLARLYPEWVNTVKNQLVWLPGMVKTCNDERLAEYAADSNIVTSSNFEASFQYFKSKIAETESFTIDFETSTPEESDDWLQSRGTPKGVDVIGSKVVSMGLNFGNNNQHSLYISVNHKDTDNCTLEQLVEFLKAIPTDKHIVAHNAAGFELPVGYTNFHHLMPQDKWRGFIPNMVDTRIAASFWDENQPSHGLKNLSKLLLNYEQESYEQVTTIDGVQHKMDELTAEHVLSYGVDDVYTTAALWNFFKLFMKLEQTYKPFLELEQKPMYLSALAYVQGLDIDLPRLSLLSKQDSELFDTSKKILDQFLIEKGWEGCVCPVYKEITPAAVKEVLTIITGVELKTMARKLDKLAILVGQIEGGETLAKVVAENDLSLFNKLAATYFIGAPTFNVGSPKQIAKLLYETIGLPIRLRNKPTATMKLEGKKEGTPKTDDDAVGMAIKFGDASEGEISVLQALLEMKSCNTRRSLYWDAYPKLMHWQTGKLHPELRQSSTNTRRWSSSSPNIQQTESSSDGVRSCIRAENERVYVSLDFSSQEVRQLASYSGDKSLLGCYIGANKRDVHSIVGAKVAGVSYETFMSWRNSEDKELTTKASAIRSISKTVLFGTLYGAAAPKIGQTLGISESEAQSYIDAIFSEFPDVLKWKEDSEKMAETLGYVTLAGGTKRHLASLITSPEQWQASKALRQAGNARIQGAGANQVKRVMSSVWDSDLLETSSLKWKFVCHDEITFTVERRDATTTIERVHKFMTQDFLGNVPSESSIGVGRNYGQLTELEKPLAVLGVGFDTQTVQTAIDKLFH